MFAERNGKFASGMSVLRRYAEPLSKLWLPRPSALKPIMFMSSIVGVSPKNAEIGGVAPTESPRGKRDRAVLAPRRGTQSNHGLRNAEPPMSKVGLTAGAGRLSAASRSGISWPW